MEYRHKARCLQTKHGTPLQQGSYLFSELDKISSLREYRAKVRELGSEIINAIRRNKQEIISQLKRKMFTDSASLSVFFELCYHALESVHELFMHLFMVFDARALVFPHVFFLG